MIGQTINHYEIVEKLGEGGMGVVYKARDTSLNRLVALKFLPSHLTKDRATRKRFIVEAQAASALDHPNICNIHEINETTDGQLYICMAYYEGVSLREKIDKGLIPFDEALKIFFRILQGLKTAHEKNIIHRDIKPGNILITTNGEVKIVDFGLAKLAGVDLTKTTSSKGTAAYMCPEQIRGQKVDHRCDIWALGIVLYEMLTGQLPFKGEYPEAMMFSIVNGQPDPLTSHLSNCPESLQIIINNLLQKNPADRYQDLSETLADLKPLLSDDRSAVIKTRTRSGKLLRRKNTYIIGSVVLLLLLVATWFGKYIVEQEVDEKNWIAVLPLVNLTSDPEQEWFTDGLTEALITELSKISGLRVISRTSAMKYKGTDKRIPEVAAELDVQYVIEGSVMRDGNQVRVTTKLIDALTDEHLWAESYEHQLKDIFILLSEAARAIVREVKIELTPQEQQRLIQIRPVNPKAYEFYLRGLLFHQSLKTDDIYKAYEYYRRATELDSTFSLPHTAMGMCNGWFTYYKIIPHEEGVSRIKKNIEDALKIDPNLAEAYHLKGGLELWQLWDWQGAEKSFQKMRELNPAQSVVLNNEYAWYFIVMGRFDEAIEEANQMLKTDPLAYLSRFTAIQSYFYARRFKESIDLCLQTIELDPTDPRAYYHLAANYQQLGRFDDAHTTRLEAMKNSGKPPEQIAYYDSLYAELGPKADPTWLLQRQKNSIDNYPVNAATIYIRLGNNIAALDYLEQAYQQRNGPLILLKVDPIWDPLRDESRFKDLIARMNYPD